MLTELSVVEPRYLAVGEVLEGAKVTDVATRYGIDRRTVHRWLLRYANEGLGALADRSSRPDRCPHQQLLRSKPGSSRSAGHIRGGARGPSFPHCGGNWPRYLPLIDLPVLSPPPPDRPETPPAFGCRTTSDGSARGPWSCGRWT
jgi:Winged helix-turn helix